MSPAPPLIDELDATSLVPEVYAEFRPMVADALRFFLQHLSTDRMSEIVRDQAMLPADANLSTRVVHFMHRCPALHKLGQVIARNRQLEPGFRADLQRLESMEPRTTVEEVRPIIQRELGDQIDRYEIQFDGEALAEASVAVVLPITCRGIGGQPMSSSCGLRGQPMDEQRYRAVLKVLKPSAAEHLREDLDILGMLADHLDEGGAGADLSSIAYREIFDEVRELLIHEIDFAQEQGHLVAAARQLAREHDVLVPEVLPFSTARITAMERIDGPKVTDLPCACEPRRRRLASTVVRALIGDVVLSREKERLFHADAHAGNLLASDDGRLGIIDWSLTGTLTLVQRELLVQIMVGAAALDGPRVCGAVEELAQPGSDRQSIARFTAEALDEVRRGRVPAISWLMHFLDRAARGGVRFPSDLLLFRKTYFTLEGVVGDLCPRCVLPRMLLQRAAGQFLSEWPVRAFSPAGSRDFATHLSSSDLVYLAALVPFTAGEWFLNAWRSWTRAVVAGG